MKLGIFSTHPIQYQIPIWRSLTQTEGLEVKVFYFSDQGLGNSIDPGFGQVVNWDIPLLEGYDYEFLSKKPVDQSHKFNIQFIDDFLKGHKFDVVLLHGYTHKFARQLVRRKGTFGYKVILRGEFTEMPRRIYNWKKVPRKLYLKWFYQHVDHFCPIGKDAIRHLQQYGFQASQMTQSPYSVDDKLFEEKSSLLDKAECRRSLNIELSQKVFLFSGKLVARKQPLLFAEALMKLYQQFPELTAIFLGSGPQFDEISSLLAPALGGRFLAPGFINQSDLGVYFKAADVFVLPSKYDTWGLVVNEAMHFGLPCIVSDMVGSRHDLVIEGETGWVFDHSNADALASCMKFFFDDSDLSRSMGEAAHLHIQNFTVEKTFDGILGAIAALK